ncbi:ankyrin repeat domain-containing protein 16-like, partial [Empidonax traillii]|uniref:ankyrin repeat domain-containing protein 16-like n=1 Tax=Empidonax traillii TaxID=164674 RepID=UPI000FFCEE5F
RCALSAGRVNSGAFHCLELPAGLERCWKRVSPTCRFAVVSLQGCFAAAQPSPVLFCPVAHQSRIAAAAAKSSKQEEQSLGRVPRVLGGDTALAFPLSVQVKSVCLIFRTPLHLAAANGHADVVRYLMRKNSQPNLADSFKRTALMKAVQQEQEECVAVLLEHGADPNLADADGNTALHLAVLSKNTAVAGLLLQHNAKSDAQNQVTLACG